jgi:very-short-patch-repair endonuclease
MNDPLAAIKRRQHGAFSRAQALSAGYSRRQIERRVESGQWRQLDVRTYCDAGLPDTWRTRVMAACLSSGGVASHRTAAVLHGLLPEDGRHVEITAGRNRYYRRTGTVVHWLTDLDRDRDVVVVDGIPTTDPVRTLIDLGAVVPVARLERALERALHRGLLTVDQLVERMEEVARRGRKGIGRLRRVLVRRGWGVAPTESDWETRFLQVLRRGGLPEPVRQHEVHVAGRVVRLDFAYPDLKIAMEYDGVEAHSGAAALEKDDARQNLLVLAGYLVLRFTKGMVRHHGSAICDEVREARMLAASRGA